MKRILIFFVYCFARIFYKKEYLSGKMFARSHLTLGWRLVLRYWFVQKIIGVNRKVPWPCSPLVKIGQWKNIEFDNDDIDNFGSPGVYFQAINAQLRIGKGTKIAPGAGLITANHSFDDLEHNVMGESVDIGKDCWIGMNAVILPGVVLGDHTIVGAGSVVTKSFTEGNCIVAGNPAKVVRYLDDSRRSS